MISLETPQRKWASSRLEGRTIWIVSSCGRCSRLTTVTSGTRSGGLRKGQSPCELLGGLSGFLSRRCQGLNLLWNWCRNLRIPLQCRHGTWGTSGVPQGSQSSSRVGECTCAFLPSCSSSVPLPFARIKGSGASLEAFQRGFPTRLSHRAAPRATMV